jgi:hypothetical protein
MKFLKLLVIFVGIPSAALAALSKAERKSQFEKAMVSIMAANNPSMSVQERERLVKEYTACKSHKGQAVELSNGNYFRSCEHEDSPDVGDRSLEACQLRYGKPCALLAVNEEIVGRGRAQVERHAASALRGKIRSVANSNHQINHTEAGRRAGLRQGHGTKGHGNSPVGQGVHIGW